MMALACGSTHHGRGMNQAQGQVPAEVVLKLKHHGCYCTQNQTMLWKKESHGHGHREREISEISHYSRLRTDQWTALLRRLFRRHSADDERQDNAHVLHTEQCTRLQHINTHHTTRRTLHTVEMQTPVDPNTDCVSSGCIPQHCINHVYSFLQRAQCSHCKRCISYGNSIRLSVRLSVRHTPVLCQNDGT